MTELGGGWTLEHKSRNWVLSRRVVRKSRETGEEYEAEGEQLYYSSLENAAQALCEKHLEGVDAHDLKALVREVKNARFAMVAGVAAKVSQPSLPGVGE